MEEIKSVSADDAIGAFFGFLGLKVDKLTAKKSFILPEKIFVYDVRATGAPIVQYCSREEFESASVLSEIQNGANKITLPKQPEIGLYFQETSNWLKISYVDTARRIVVKMRHGIFSESDETEGKKFFEMINSAALKAKNRPNLMILNDDGYEQEISIF